jgi:hypothetical protein
MPRYTRTEPTRRLHVEVHVSLAEAFDDLIRDPFSERAVYGARTKIVEELMKAFVQAKQNGENSISLTNINAYIRSVTS